MALRYTDWTIVRAALDLAATTDRTSYVPCAGAKQVDFRLSSTSDTNGINNTGTGILVRGVAAATGAGLTPAQQGLQQAPAAAAPAGLGLLSAPYIVSLSPAAGMSTIPHDTCCFQVVGSATVTPALQIEARAWFDSD